MGTALSLLIFICLFVLTIGLFGSFLGSTEEEKRRMRSEHEARRIARQPWDAGGRSNR